MSSIQDIILKSLNKDPKDYTKATGAARYGTLQSHMDEETSTPTVSQQGYTPSESVIQAQNNLTNLQKPGAFESPWQTQLNDVIDKIMNREKFSYDLNGDALYQQYKDQYVTQGQQAMMDTIGQAAALTGGYGNSHAQSVGQQTYQGYLQQLNDKIPELYQLALDQYNREGEDMYNQYGLLADRENTDYGRYRDQMSDYYTDRDYLAGRYDTEYNKDYTLYRDNVADTQWKEGHDLEVDKFEHTVDMDNKNFGLAVDQFDHTVEMDNKNYDFMVGEAERDQANKDREYELTVSEIEREQGNLDREYELKVQEANRNYSLAVAEINEMVRHNMMTEAQAAEEIKLAWAQLEESKRQADLDYQAATEALAWEKAQAQYAVSSPEPTSEPNTFDYSSWGTSQWESYFAQIRQTEGKAAAEKELNEFTRAGLIPKQYVSAAATGARGSSGGH